MLSFFESSSLLKLMSKGARMKNANRISIFCAAAALAISLVASVYGPAFADAGAPNAQMQVAQLQMVTPAMRRCQEACNARAQSCYHNARGGRAKEDCENGATSCKRHCH
jgi:hypothetical protein